MMYSHRPGASRTRSYAFEQHNQKVKEATHRATEFSRDINTKKVLDAALIGKFASKADTDYEKLNRFVHERYAHFEAIAHQLDESERKEVEAAHEKLRETMEGAYEGLRIFLAYESFLSSETVKNQMKHARDLLMKEVVDGSNKADTHHQFKEGLSPEHFMVFKKAISQLVTMYREEVGKNIQSKRHANSIELPVDVLWGILGEHQIFQTEQRLNSLNQSKEGVYAAKGAAGGDLWLDRAGEKGESGNSVGQVCVDIRDHGDQVGGMKTLVEAFLRSIPSKDNKRMFSMLHEFLKGLGVKYNNCSLVDTRIERTGPKKKIHLKIAGDVLAMVLDEGKLKVIRKQEIDFGGSTRVVSHVASDKYMNSVGTSLFRLPTQKVEGSEGQRASQQIQEEPEIVIEASSDAVVILGTDGVADLFRELMVDEDVVREQKLASLAKFCDEHSPDNKEVFIKALIAYIKDQAKTDDVTLRILR